MADVHLFHTADGGEISVVNGVFQMREGWESAAYLSLFGGNERDSGVAGDDPLQWWANVVETREERRYRSETQNLLRSIPAVPGNLRRIEDAAGRDLAWFVELGHATQVSARATIPALNRVNIQVAIEINGEVLTADF